MHLKKLLKSKLRLILKGLAHTKLKKELFDDLDSLCKFEVPEGMVELEYNSLLESTGVKPDGKTKKR